MSLIPHCRCAACWKPIIFVAGAKLIVWFSIADELHCKRPLIFGACGELPLLFGTTDVLHCKKTLIFVAYLFWTTSFIPYRSWAALRNTFYIWCFVFNHFFRLPLVMWCYEKRPMFGPCFAIPLLFVTFHVLTCKIPLLFCACVDLQHLFRTLYVCCNAT